MVREFDVTWNDRIEEMVDEINERLEKGDEVPVGGIMWSESHGQYYQSLISKTSLGESVDSSAKKPVQQLKAKISAIADRVEQYECYSSRDEIFNNSVIAELRELSAI